MSEDDFRGDFPELFDNDTVPMPERRSKSRVHSVNIVTINPEDLTAEDVKNLKQIARYYSAGKLLLLLILCIGFGGISVVDWLNSWLHHFKVN